jgi:hypothetical protein
MPFQNYDFRDLGFEYKDNQKNLVFIQDNAKVHICLNVCQFLRKNNVEVLVSPSQCVIFRSKKGRKFLGRQNLSQS